MPLGVFVFGDFGVFDDFGDLPFGVFALRILFETVPSKPPRDKAFSFVRTSSIANESTIASTAVIKFQIRIFLKRISQKIRLLAQSGLLGTISTPTDFDPTTGIWRPHPRFSHARTSFSSTEPWSQQKKMNFKHTWEYETNEIYLEPTSFITPENADI